MNLAPIAVGLIIIAAALADDPTKPSKPGKPKVVMEEAPVVREGGPDNKEPARVQDVIEKLPSLQVFEPTTNLQWKVGSNILHLTLSTNLLTNWVTVEELQLVGTNQVRARQVGTIQTNRMLFLSYQQATNYGVLLEVLGRAEWPSEKRVAVVPRTR